MMTITSTLTTLLTLSSSIPVSSAPFDSQQLAAIAAVGAIGAAGSSSAPAPPAPSANAAVVAATSAAPAPAPPASSSAAAPPPPPPASSSAAAPPQPPASSTVPAAASSAAPATPAPAAPLTAPFQINVDQLNAISSKSMTCAAGGQYASQCRTNAQAVAPINNSLTKYQIYHPSVAAAVISLMLFESGNFQYAQSEFPTPTPGKGTRNMQSPDFNAKYAQSLNMSVDQVVSGTDDNASFGSGAWFITTQCDFSVRQGLWGGQLGGWSDYITKCVQTTVTSERQDLWAAAIKALGTA